MILRIEKHFKAEQAARKKAEELLQAAIAAELDMKNKLEDALKKRRDDARALDEERTAIKRVSEAEAEAEAGPAWARMGAQACRLCVWPWMGGDERTAVKGLGTQQRRWTGSGSSRPTPTVAPGHRACGCMRMHAGGRPYPATP